MQEVTGAIQEVLTILILSAVMWLIKLAAQKLGISISADQEAQIRGKARAVIVRTEEIAARRVKESALLLNAREKANLAVQGLIEKSPGLSEEDAERIIHEELPKLGLGSAGKTVSGAIGIILLFTALLGIAPSSEAANLSPRGGGATDSYETIQNQGTSLTQRRTVNFTGAGVTCVDDPGNTKTVCTVTNVPDTEDPTQPADLAATTVSTTEIDLTWTASTDNVAVVGYKIYRCSGAACTPTVEIDTDAGSPYSDTGLTPDTTYGYAVSAYDAADNESTLSTTDYATTDAEGGPPPAFVQAPAPVVASAISHSRTFASAPTVGNCVIVDLSQWTGTGITVAVDSVTDLHGNTYALADDQNSVENGIRAWMYYAPVVSTGSPFTVTVAQASSADSGIMIREYSGVDCATPSTNSGTAGASTALASGTVNPPATALYVMGAAFGPQTFTLTSAGWTSRGEIESNNTANIVGADFVGEGSQGATGTLGAATTWSSVIAAFNAN